MKHIVVIISALAFLTACGPSKVEIEKRKQFVADSIAAAEKTADSLATVERIRKENQRIHEEKIEVGKELTRTKLQSILESLNKAIRKENGELAEIQEFQLLRSSSTKRKQVRSQTDKINELKQFKSRLEKEIALTHLHESYDFQKSPEGTVKHLFDAAKNKDFSKLRHLKDPYGEYDGNVLELCLIEIEPEDAQSNWISFFENGRLMGEPVINDKNAEIEIAIGRNSDRLERMNLVKRMDKWYLISL